MRMSVKWLGRPLPPGFGWVTQWFGENVEDYLPAGFAGHEGLDYGVPVGTPVLAAASGVVERAGESGTAYGIYVVLCHGSVWRTFYCHLNEVASAIHVGGNVLKGQIIGWSGSTGKSTGPHLHFGLQHRWTRNGSKGMVDPVPYRE